MKDPTTLLLLINGISAICFFLGVFVVNSFKESLKSFGVILGNIQHTIGDLNMHLATLIEKDANKDQRLNEQRKLIGKNEKELDKLRERYHDNVNSAVSKVDLLMLEVESIKKRLDNK